MTENNMASSSVAVPQAYMFIKKKKKKKKNGATMYINERSSTCRHRTCYGEC